MPLNLNGKINYGALPSLDEARESVKRDFVAPRSAAEELVAGVWSDVLGVERISVHDNFFESGGHSLLATRVISRLREAFQVDIPLRRLFERPTVEGLVAVITQIWGGPEVVEEIARTVKEVEQLSPEMTRQMLAEESITSQT
jgi:acyl carrier protein